MSNMAPVVRIILRYIVGASFVLGPAIGERLAKDPDVVMLGAAAVGLLVEIFYLRARRKGGAT